MSSEKRSTPCTAHPGERQEVIDPTGGKSEVLFTKYPLLTFVSSILVSREDADPLKAITEAMSHIGHYPDGK